MFKSCFNDNIYDFDTISYWNKLFSKNWFLIQDLTDTVFLCEQYPLKQYPIFFDFLNKPTKCIQWDLKDIQHLGSYMHNQCMLLCLVSFQFAIEKFECSHTDKAIFHKLLNVPQMCKRIGHWLYQLFWNKCQRCPLL